ncbi:MAG: hypothetical protein EZS28_011336 [Streblomastix strix]|uniref:Uncharacterized protein n=1 Tax=Streblomastix strix TaxID=222440 RepID=A0A5J4WDU3_9EUKA|nr:MAG: hypothetical protein EZS28_011336 [Streblomastix strix]
MAYGLMDQFKAKRGFITYDFETLSDQVMKNVIDQTTLLSQLSQLSIASTEVFPNQDKSYELVKRCYTLFDELSEDYQKLLKNYGQPFNSSFVHLWLAQTFKSAEQIYQCMKYSNENIPFLTDVLKDWDGIVQDLTLLCYGMHQIVNFGHWVNLLVLDRQDNELPHTKDNCLPACVSYNIAHANRDPKLTSLHIKMRQYAIKHNLPMIITDERIYNLLRECITGGLTAVFHRENIADQRKDISVAKVKGYFPNSEYNNLLPFPPIFRNIEIENKEEVIGEYTYSQAQKHSLPMTKKDRKLTTLLDTNGQFMVFNNYYLWLLIDLGFIIIDYKAIAVFEKNAAYEPLVRMMMNLRIQALLSGSSKEKFNKLIINTSYGKDILNTEKFGKIKMLDKADTFIVQHHPNHIGTRRISANTFAVQIKPKIATCFTSLQSGVLSWIMRNIAGDPSKDCHQQFQSIVTDKQFYDQHVYQYLPDPNKDIYDYKKILGFGIENEGYELTSLGNKFYSMILHKWSNERQQYEFQPKITSKGISKSQQISHNDYINGINKDRGKKRINGTLKMYDNVMSSIQVEKYALTGFSNKSIVLRNQCCCPYIKGLTAKDYIIKDQ